MGTSPNAYVKAEHLEVYLCNPKGMVILDDALRKLGVDTKAKLALRLEKSLYD